MVDSLLSSLERARAVRVRATELGLSGPVRPGHVAPARAGRRPGTLWHSVLSALDEIAAELPLVFPVHPRTQANIEAFGLRDDRVRTSCSSSRVGYLEFLHLEADASLVLTDSGGIQEETTVLGVPCLTVRENTERPITVTQGTNHLVGSDPDTICRVAAEVMAQRPVRRCPPLWDGHSAERIAAVLAEGTPEVVWTHQGATPQHGVDR